ncbi:MAG: alpha/beta hydrolase [Lachnospiraceae bacterium]|nr:alpha/beta hydrolase [Lachnospiraceae bacterium]
MIYWEIGICRGDILKRIILYIHGKGGSYLEAEQYKKNCLGFDIIGIDYNDYFPWIVQNQIQSVYDKVRERYDCIYLIANSIGAYFAMHTLQDCDIAKALFISPVLDMERLILDMMNWANVSEKDLREKGEIPTDFGETLSWKYLCFVRENPITWNVPTEILYAGNDNLVSRQTVNEFISNHNTHLTVMENGEHWFHTDEQLAFLDIWMKKAIG